MLWTLHKRFCSANCPCSSVNEAEVWVSALLDWLCSVPNVIYTTEPQWWERIVFLY